jgi:hypothetical protein
MLYQISFLISWKTIQYQGKNYYIMVNVGYDIVVLFHYDIVVRTTMSGTI